MEPKELVLKILKESDQTPKGGDIANKTGIEEKELDKAIKQLKTEALIFSPKRCFYDAK